MAVIVRLRNVTTGELRDVAEDSEEYEALTAAVYAYKDESRPRWVPAGRALQADEGIDTTLQVSFGITGLPPLTEGEFVAGIKTPEQKARELGLLPPEDEAEEEEEEEEDDEEEEEEEDETPPAAARRSSTRRPPSKST